MTWRGPGLVDHHTHLLETSAGAPAPWAGEGVAAYHRRVAGAASTPMDEPPAPLPAAPGELAARLAGGLGRAAALGLCQVTEAGLRHDSLWRALGELRSAGDLPVRVRVLFSSGLADRAGGPRALVERRTGDPQLEVEGVKLYADGWLGARTCALCRPFADAGTDGLLFLGATDLARRAAPYAEAGLAVATHAIGDRAVGAVLDAYEAVLAGQRAAPGRLRVEHAQVLSPELVDRMAAAGVTACIQPSFAASDWQEAVAALGPERAAWAYRWDALLDAGVPVVGGSDHPIESLDPLDGLADLVTGRGTGCPTLPAAQALAVVTDPAAGTTVWTRDPSEGVNGVAVVEAHPAR